MSKLNQLSGKEVIIYPGDTHQKKGIIEEITDSGVLFKITKAPRHSIQYKVGSLHFISFSAKLSFREL